MAASAVTGDYQRTNPLDALKPKAPNNDEIFSSKSFLKLLGAQMKSQNPLEPMKDTEFISQMAGFSQLEQITTLTQSIKSLNLTSQLSQGAALVGHEVTYTPVGDNVPVSGKVDKMVLENGGRDSALIVNGQRVAISQVQEVH